MIFIEILNKLHVGVINLLAIFITISTFGLIRYALSKKWVFELFNKKVSINE